VATNFWRGDSQPVAQVSRFTVGGVAHTGDVLTLSCNLKEVTYTLVGGDTFATAAAALAAAWTAATFAEAKEAEVSYTDGLSFLDLVASEPGRPFTVASSVTGGGATTTLTASAVTASRGPSHADDADNWTLGIPTNVQDVVIAGGKPILYGLGVFDGLTYDVRASYGEAIGLPRWNPAGYYEYRTRELTLNAATVNVGRGDGPGSSRLLLKSVAASTWNVFRTGSRETDTVPALDIGATGNATAIKVSGSSDVGYLVEDESTARVIANVSLAGDDARLTIGRTATVTNLDKDSGTCDVYGTVTNPTLGRGLYTQFEGGFVTMVAYGGTVRLLHSGTATTVTGKGKGGGELGPVFDCEGNNGPRTFTNSSFTGGAYLLDENKSVALDAGGTHTADPTFFANSRLGPTVTWNRS
jgi:hypothetical protein